jgi:hypothetical protein
MSGHNGISPISHSSPPKTAQQTAHGADVSVLKCPKEWPTGTETFVIAANVVEQAVIGVALGAAAGAVAGAALEGPLGAGLGTATGMIVVGGMAAMNGYDDGRKQVDIHKEKLSDCHLPPGWRQYYREPL